MFANDIDDELIAFYQYIHNGGQPLDDVTKEQYYEIKNNGEKYLKGNIKYMASFGGKAWGGYGFRRDSNKSHYLASLTNFLKEIPIIRKANFSNLNYDNLKFLPGSFVYCDPPYKGTTGYNNKNFDHDKFYQWARTLSL